MELKSLDLIDVYKKFINAERKSNKELNEAMEHSLKKFKEEPSIFNLSNLIDNDFNLNRKEKDELNANILVHFLREKHEDFIPYENISEQKEEVDLGEVFVWCDEYYIKTGLSETNTFLENSFLKFSWSEGIVDDQNPAYLIGFDKKRVNNKNNKKELAEFNPISESLEELKELVNKDVQDNTLNNLYAKKNKSRKLKT